MTDHPLTETAAARAEPLARTLLGVPEDHGAPRHDGEREDGKPRFVKVQEGEK